VNYFVSGGKAPYNLQFTLAGFATVTNPCGTVANNFATCPVTITAPCGITATFQIVVVDSLGASVTSDVNIAP
jgi:hypothetical protein